MQTPKYVDFADEDKKRLMPLLVWEARVYMSPKRPSSSMAAAPRSVEGSAQFYQYVRAQFKARQKKILSADKAYSWEQFCEDTGFGPGQTQSRGTARKHGLYARKLKLSEEEVGQLDALKAELEETNQPTEGAEHTLVCRIAEAMFRLRQLRGYETDCGEPWVNLRPEIRKAIGENERRLEQVEIRLRKLQTTRGFKASSPAFRSHSAGSA